LVPVWLHQTDFKNLNPQDPLHLLSRNHLLRDREAEADPAAALKFGCGLRA
jgi:hypothetical protein